MGEEEEERGAADGSKLRALTDFPEDWGSSPKTCMAAM